jgi:mannose-1-phosphate guanylyltransferase
VLEAEIRGTAGGVAGARSRFEPGAVLVWNGDILTEAPVRELLELATARDAQVLAVSPRPAGEGTVGMDETGALVRLRGQVFGRETQSGDYIGVQALGPRVLASLPDKGCLFGDVALPHLAAGSRVWTVQSTAAWSDLGDLRAYVAANFAWLDSLQPTANGQPRLDSLAPLTAKGQRLTASWIAPDVAIAPGITVQRSLLGLGAKLTGAGAVTDVIAWPGAAVVAPLSRAVVLSSGRVVPFDESAEN